MALVYAIRPFPDNICTSGADAFVDNQVMIARGSVKGEGPRSSCSASWYSLESLFP